MTPEGAIVCRPGISARRGEERFAAQTLSKLGVPIIRTINGGGIFDGACAMGGQTYCYSRYCKSNQHEQGRLSMS